MSTDIHFPASLARVIDSKYFAIEKPDNAVTGKLEGGYIHARPRTTRRPLSKITIGFTELPQELMNELETFWDRVGGHTEFIFTHPGHEVNRTYRVHFTGTLKAKYSGVGQCCLYNIQALTMQET